MIKYKAKNDKNEYENPLDVFSNNSMFKPYSADFNEFEVVENEVKANIDVFGIFKAGIKILTKKIKNEASSGYSSQLASSGYYSQLASSGYYSQLASSGYYSQLASSGDSSHLASSGYSSKLASSGDSSQLASSGDSSKLASSGYYSKLASSGYSSQLASSGDSSQLASSGDCSIIMACGHKSICKGVNGTWVSLAEHKMVGDKWIPAFAKSFQIGNKEYKDWKGKELKEDTYYTLVDRELRPVTVIDGIETTIISTKKVGDIKIHKGVLTWSNKKTIVAEQDGVFAHGETVKEAIEDLRFKMVEERGQEQYRDLTLESELTLEDAQIMYRIVTGACRQGTAEFIEGLAEVKEKYTIAEMIEITKGEHGNECFRRFIEREEN